MQRVEIIGVNTAELPKLTRIESEELINKIKKGDKVSREKFVIANMRLVLSIVQRFNRQGMSSDDLFQIGCVGLLKAVNNFDVSQNVRFSTYAVPMIIGEIRRFIRDGSGIKVSRNIRDVAYKALKAREILMETSDLTPSLTEISSEIGIPISEIACALDAVSTPVSFFEPVFNDGEDSMMLLEQIGDKKNHDDLWLENLDLREALKLVPKKEREVLYLRYYLGRTQVEISREINISQAQVSRLEKNAVSRLRQYLN